jgi:putative transposase
MNETTTSPLGNVITIDDERIKNHLDRVSGGDPVLDAKADRLCNAQRYERNEARRDTRAGHYERKLQTKAGEVWLKIPILRQQTFETANITSSIQPFRQMLWHNSRAPSWDDGIPKDPSV